MLRKFRLTASYVTRLPLAQISGEPDELSGLAKYLPGAGIIVGIIMAALADVAQELHVSPLMTGVIVFLAWLSVTGGIHFDGLMDTADGIGSHRSIERMIEIMSDSRVGNFGVMAGMAVMLVKVAGVASLSAAVVLPALILIPVCARWCQVYAIGAFPYVKAAGMGKIWHDTTKLPGDLVSAFVWVVAAASLCVYLWGTAAVLTIIFVTLCAGVISSYLLSAVLHGHTGDTYGAVVEITEAAALLMLTTIVPL